MKKCFAALLLGSTLLTGCQFETAAGPCIGAFDTPSPNQPYHVSIRNIVLGSIFASLIVPPVVVIATATRCPDAK